MTSPGRYAASDGSFAKSAGSAAARGGILIAIAVVIGFVLLWQGFDGGESDAAVGGPDTTDSTPSDDTTDTTPPTDSTDPSDSTPPTDSTDPSDSTPPTDSTPPELDDPSTIKVAVLNATGEAGLASERGEVLGALGYVWTAGNAAESPLTDSKVYFVPGYADEAKVVAEALSGPPTVLDIAPEDPATLASPEYAADTGAADIIVVLGTDNALR
jgi:cytoskeletal protein RodZ